jgi:Phage portal protein, SPP1 Gp6-like
MSELDDLRAAARRKLDDQARRAAGWQSYYDNEAGIIALLDTEERQAFRSFLAEAHANWCELVVNAVAERLRVTGFRFGTGGTSDAAWAIWQANSMDADHGLAQLDALVTGSSFVLVQPDDDNPSGVSVSIESPRQATVLYQPGTRRKRRAGYKRFADEADNDKITEVLVLPGSIVTWLPDARAPLVEPNPAGVVGLVELVPQPRTLGWPRSELESAFPIQDRINTTIYNRIVATDYSAYRQVWATGVRIARNVIKDGGSAGDAARVVKPFDIGANRLLTSENPDSRFGAIPESNLRGYLDAVEQDVNMLAAITQTPPHYLLGQLVNLAADAIKAAEAGLVSKVRGRALHLGENWEDVMRIALGLIGDPGAAEVSAEVIWADPETRSIAQLADALVKLRDLGVPRQVIWEMYGTTPQEIARWKALLAAEAPEPAPAPPPVPPPVPVPAG